MGGLVSPYLPAVHLQDVIAEGQFGFGSSSFVEAANLKLEELS